MSKKISVIGSGSWGVALAYLLNSNGHDVKLWSYSQEEADMINNEKRCKFLPEHALPDNLPSYTSLEETIKDTEIILIVTPSMAIRSTLNNMKPFVKDNQVFLLCSKGMEPDTQKVFTEVIEEIYPNNKVAALSGPSHAEEVGRRVPTTVVAGAKDEKTAKEMNFEYVDLDKLYKESDIISLHCPLTDENYKMINEESLEKMKNGVVLINTSRGKLIDTKSLI